MNKNRHLINYNVDNVMQQEALTELLLIIEKNRNIREYGDDLLIIDYVYNALLNLDSITNIKELEVLENKITYLDIKYDEFMELGYYFGPLHASIQHKIHNLEVKKMREKNKRKREGK